MFAANECAHTGSMENQLQGSPHLAKWASIYTDLWSLQSGLICPILYTPAPRAAGHGETSAATLEGRKKRKNTITTQEQEIPTKFKATKHKKRRNKKQKQQMKKKQRNKTIATCLGRVPT
jgi:hypothetical protein